MATFLSIFISFAIFSKYNANVLQQNRQLQSDADRLKEQINKVNQLQNSLSNTPASGGVQSKKKICPDAWIRNEMPGPDVRPEEYLIINGQRAETSGYDLDWIKINCQIKEAEIVS